MAERLQVEVAYVEPGRQFLQGVDLPVGATVADALAAVALQQHFPALDLAGTKLGIFSRPATLASVLRDGDRVEVYRPLQVDPKAVRRQRAARGAPVGKG